MATADCRAEEWRAVVGFPGYEVSDRGRVRSYIIPGPSGYLSQTPHLIRLAVGNRRPRCTVFLRSKGTGKRKRIPVHVLVLEAFIAPRPGPDYWALHRDDNPFNNNLLNLYWGSPTENAADRGRNGHNRDQRGVKHNMARLTDAQVEEIRARHAAGELQRNLARDFGVCRTSISLICSGKRWRHV